MKIEIIEKKYKASDKLKEIITNKLSKLDKYFGSSAKARVVLGKENKLEKLELTITNKGLLYRAEASSDNNYANIDLVLPKIERQVVRQNEKQKKVRGRTEAISYEFITEKPEALPEVYKRKYFDLEPMIVDEAREMIERLDHEFYIFLNAETGKVNVLYKRKDNKFGLIEVNF